MRCGRAGVCNPAGTRHGRTHVRERAYAVTGPGGGAGQGRASAAGGHTPTVHPGRIDMPMVGLDHSSVKSPNSSSAKRVGGRGWPSDGRPPANPVVAGSAAPTSSGHARPRLEARQRGRLPPARVSPRLPGPGPPTPASGGRTAFVRSRARPPIRSVARRIRRWCGCRRCRSAAVLPAALPRPPHARLAGVPRRGNALHPDLPARRAHPRTAAPVRLPGDPAPRPRALMPVRL